MYSLEVNRITVNACMHFESLLQFQINSSCTRQDTLVRGKNLMEKPKKKKIFMIKPVFISILFKWFNLTGHKACWRV